VSGGSPPAAPLGAAPAAHDARARLMANENPFGPGPAARQALIAAAEPWAARYPMVLLNRLTEKLAALHGVPASQIILGSGAAELLNATALITLAPGKELLTARPTFDFMLAYAVRRGAALREVPLTASLHFDLGRMAQALSPATGLIYICNPNNPTGTVLDAGPLAEFIRHAQQFAPVLVDEAYLDLLPGGADQSQAALARDGLDVLVARTFSKLHGLAGLRLGYVIAPEARARALEGAKMSFPSGPAAAAAMASLDDLAFQDQSRAQVAAARDRLTAILTQAGLKVFPSVCNFVFADCGEPHANFAGRLKEKGIVIGTSAYPDYPTAVRISIGLPHELDLLAGALGVSG